jgi:hypothetical protein
MIQKMVNKIPFDRLSRGLQRANYGILPFWKQMGSRMTENSLTSLKLKL